MSKLLDSMAAYGADTEGVLDRFMDDEELYATCLEEFVETTDLESLRNYIDTKDYDNAFEVVHALKGVSGNLGLSPLFTDACVLVEALRAKEYGDIESQYKDVYDRMQEFLAVYKSV